MPNNEIHSDQLYDWSGFGCPHRFFISPARRARQRTGRAPTTRPAGILDRTLQTLWQPQLQMPAGQRPWPQILPFRQPIGRTAPNGLRAGGISPADFGLFAKFSQSAPIARKHLPDQSPVIEAPSHLLNLRAHGAFTPITYRPGFGGGACRQFLAGLAASRLGCVNLHPAFQP